MTTRQAAAALGIPARRLQWRAQAARRRGREVPTQQYGRSYVAPLSWWRALAAEPQAAGRPRVSNPVG